MDMAKIFCKFQFLIIVIGVFIFTCLVYALASYICPDYSKRMVTGVHISMVISIITTFIIGGCVILLMENQHVEGEVTSRYYTIMRPFYHRLTAYCKFAQQCMFALSALDEDGRKTKKILEEKSVLIKRVALNSILTGKDSSWLKSDFLKDLCDSVNNMWYIFDRNYDFYSHLSFNNKRLIEEVRNALMEYDKTYSDSVVSLHLLPKVSGDFYVKDWQPIDNVPIQFEQFLKKKQKSQRIASLCFVIEIVSLLIVYLSDGSNGVSLLSVDLLVILSLLSFCLGMFKYFQLKSSIRFLQF